MHTQRTLSKVNAKVHAKVYWDQCGGLFDWVTAVVLGKLC